jgi:dienelactone hydrolase
MKQPILFLFFLFGISFIGFSQLGFDPKFKAKEILYLLKNGKFETICLRMDPVMKRMMDEEKLMGFWDILEMSNGQILEVGEPLVTTKDKLAVTVTVIQYEKKKVGLKIVFNEKGEIAGLFLVSPTPQYQHPDYVNTNTFYEFKMVLPDPNFPLDGVLTLPRKGDKFPVIIIVGDVGAIDKDGSIGPNKIYKDLAWGLADNGVAVYRYDKRNFAYPKDLVSKKNLTPNDEYLIDLKNAIKQVKKVPEIDSNQIIVLGHGLGAYFIPYFQKSVPNIHGFISFNGNFSNLSQLLVQQNFYLTTKLAEPQKQEAKLNLQKANYALNALSVKSKSDSLPYGFSASYWLFLKENGPTQHIAEVVYQPILFLQGNRDYQVPISELEQWKNLGQTYAIRTWTFASFPKLNHLGLEGEGPSLPAEYLKPNNIPYEVILRIASFVLY